MYMTRDRDMICLWNCEADDLYQVNGLWHIIETCGLSAVCAFWPKEFKQTFPKQKLPRKGSCKYVELRLYIPGEGVKE